MARKKFDSMRIFSLLAALLTFYFDRSHRPDRKIERMSMCGHLVRYCWLPFRLSAGPSDQAHLAPFLQKSVEAREKENAEERNCFLFFIRTIFGFSSISDHLQGRERREV